jgi:phosphoglycerol transferase MdoB-like AlkP superfamily enzyme
MKNRFNAFSGYALFWLVFFTFARLFFILTHHNNATFETFAGLSGTFLHGILLDISTTGYYMLVPMLAASLMLYGGSESYRVALRWYSYLLIAFSSLIIVADSSLYTYWGYRMDYTPLFYLKTPGAAMASVSTIKLIVLVLTFVLISSAFIFLYRRYLDPFFGKFERITEVRQLIPDTLIFLLFTGALIIPIRGGFGIAPINAGSVYFSNRMFLNHTAINPIWNVGTTAFTNKPVSNPYEYSSYNRADSLFASLGMKTDTMPASYLKTERPNVLFVIMESFSGYCVGSVGGDSTVTPNLNRYSREGILFRNFYASGTRTDKALPAILNGYPAQPAESIIKEPKKTQSLPSLVRIMIENGYRTAFWYGGDINFANFNSFVIGSGFHTIVTQTDFDASDYNAKWGVHDHILFNSLKDSMAGIKEPFFNVVLTLSSHEPFDVPMNPVITGNDDMSRYKNSVYYTDKALGGFLDWAKGQEWWDNTLIVLVADHGARIFPEWPAFSREIFKIPMIWTGGALKEKGIVVDKIGSQVDIPLTLLDQLRIKADFPFGKDILAAGSPSFAFYTFNEGFGFLTDSSWVAYDQKPKAVVEEEGRNPKSAEMDGKAFLQVLFRDYLAR